MPVCLVTEEEITFSLVWICLLGQPEEKGENLENAIDSHGQMRFFDELGREWRYYVAQITLRYWRTERALNTRYVVFRWRITRLSVTSAEDWKLERILRIVLKEKGRSLMALWIISESLDTATLSVECRVATDRGFAPPSTRFHFLVICSNMI